jgi:hypothetical protein
MTDDLLHSISTDPRAYRDNLIVRGASGPALFASILRPFQMEVLESIDLASVAVRQDRMPPVTRIWWEASKGSGKDTLAAAAVLWLLAFAPRSLLIQAGAADKSQADELRRAAVAILRLNDWLGDFVKAHNWNLVNEVTGSRAEIIPADEAGAHGSRPDVTILNELVHHADGGFASTMMDNSAKVPTNVSLVLTNAGTIDTWQWKWRELARNSQRWRFHKHDRPAPWVNPDELAERRIATNESRFRRLWFGAWAHQNESALSDAAIEAAVVLPGPQHAREADNEQAFAGLDVGVSQDRTGFAILTRIPQQRTRLAHCRSWTPPRGGKVNLMEVEDAVLDAHERFRFSVVHYDPTQAELLAQRLRTKGVPMVAVPFTAASLQEMASALLESFNSATIELFDHRQLIGDLRALRFIERGNAYRLDAARTKEGHADLATAFVLALLAVKRNPMLLVRPFVDRPIIRTIDEMRQRLEELDRAEGIVTPRPVPVDEEPRERARFFCPRCGRMLAGRLCTDCQSAAVERSVVSLALEENGLLNPDSW